jgi:Tfp pilus assembly protein PilN
MIEIDLLEGASARRPRGRWRLDLGALLRGTGERFRDPWLVIAILSVGLALGLGGAMGIVQRQEAVALQEEETLAVQDSVRFHAVLERLRTAQAQRDSVVAQMGTIVALDRQRFLWPQLLDEIARALPVDTWLRSVAQSSAATTPSAEQVAADSLPPLTLRLVGMTLDLQALTNFMRQLEASPLIADVRLAASSMTPVEGQSVNEFTLDLRAERPVPREGPNR